MLPEIKTKSVQGKQENVLLLLRPIWLKRWYDYRTTDWASELDYPEFTMKQTEELLQILC